MNYVFQCSCGVRVEGDEIFVKHAYDDHLQCRDTTTTVADKEPRNSIVRHSIVELSSPGSALRARLNAAAQDLASAGYSPQEIAMRLEAGEPVDV